MDTTRLSTLPSNVSRGLEKEFDELPDLDPFGRDKDNPKPRKFQGLLYGRPGCGKSVLAAKIAAMYGGNVLILDAENSMEVLKDEEWQYLWDMANWTAKDFPGFSELSYLLPIWAKKQKYDTVIIDSYTSAMGFDMRDILINAGFTRGSAPGFKELSTQQDYGVMLNRLIYLFDVAIRTRMNFIVTAHAKDPSDQAARRGQKTTIHGSDNQENAVSTRIANFFFCTSEKNEKGERIRRVYTRDGDDFEAKCRISQLPDRMTQDSLVRRLEAYKLGIPYEPQSAK